jgi:cyclophilin family peptidyl-prolyl cis-trans isomerase
MEKSFQLKQGLLSLALIILVLLISPLSVRGDNTPPFELPPRSEILKIRSAVLETTRGTIYLELFPEEAPWHVANFKYLADKGFYRGLTFHVYRPNFLIQGGDPLGTGFGGPGYTLPPEFSSRHHTFGTLGMSRKPDTASRKGRPLNPQRRSSGSQFYITLGEAPDMDSLYTVFGKVVGGADVVQELRAGDKIQKLTVYIREGGR